MDKIQNNALLVKVTCTKWNNTVTDKRISDEVTVDKNADDGFIRVSKRLAKVAVVKELNKLIGQVGNSIIRKWCVPWEDGVHLITVDNLDNFERDLRAKADKLDELKIELRREWPDIVRDDQLRLGSAFNALDYPEVEAIVGKYSINYLLRQLPSGDDIRVNLPNERVKAIRAEVERDVNDRIEAGMKSVHERVSKVLNSFIDGLDRHGTKGDGQQRASKFSDSTVTAIEELAETLPNINLTGDPALTAVSNDLILRLRDLDPQKLRDDPTERKNAADTARDIAAKLTGFFD
jgi:hypothetical protein